jgi:hypothetical protein
MADKPSAADLLAQVSRAALNNAAWCDAVCSARGVATSFRPHCWIAAQRAPALYPNIVTLQADAVADQLAVIGELTGSLCGGGWALKDSFDLLDLAPLGFQPLFRATWMEAPPDSADPTLLEERIKVERVSSPAGLASWERQWRASGSGAGAATTPTFAVALSECPEVAFVIAIEDGRCAGGLVANCAAGVIGISNVFGDAAPMLGRRMLAAVAGFWPGLPMVTYGVDAELGLLRAIGFHALADLRVWRYLGPTVRADRARNISAPLPNAPAGGSPGSLLLPQPAPQPRRTGDGPLDGGTHSVGGSDDDNSLASSGDRGVQELAGKDRRAGIGQHDGDGVEL